MATEPRKQDQLLNEAQVLELLEGDESLVLPDPFLVLWDGTERHAFWRLPNG